MLLDHDAMIANAAALSPAEEAPRPATAIPLAGGFALGTRILTPRGERPVEALRPGDPVITRDHGQQRLRWSGRRSAPGTGARAPMCLLPLVGDQAEGLLIPPDHRLLVTGYEAELLFGVDEVLVNAGDLENGRDIRRAPCPQIGYVHLLFDRHEVIYAGGIACESLFFGPALPCLSPELRDIPVQHRETARPCLTPHEAALLRPRLEDRGA